MTHTEYVHVFFGFAVAIAGALAFWSGLHPASRLRFVWPIMIFLIGLCLFIPVEAQTRTYQIVPWWQAALSVVPQHPSRWLHDWIVPLSQIHVIQHKLAGLLTMVIGVVEWRRARGAHLAAVWRWLLPGLMITVGLLFGIHGGNMHHLPHRVEQVHHHILGAALGVSGLLLLGYETGTLRARAWGLAWTVLLMLVGLDIGLFYRLDPTDRGMGAMQHEGTGTGMR